MVSALTQLDRLKKGNGRLNSGAQEAINWLDNVTSDPETSERVQLQGVDEAYETWEEVERHLLPVTLFSMDELDREVEGVTSQLENGLNTTEDWDVASAASTQSFASQTGETQPKAPSSPISSFASLSPPGSNANSSRPGTAKSTDSLNQKNRNRTRNNRYNNGTTIPAALKPLFNHIMWRVNQEPNSEAALQSYVLLTNDNLKQTIAQRFGIRTRRLEHLRDVLSREDRDYRNRLQLFKKEHPDLGRNICKKPIWSPALAPPPPIEDVISDDEDVVLLQRRGSTKENMAAKATQAPAESKVLDPNDFYRGTPTSPTTPLSPPREPRGNGRGGRRNAGRGKSLNGSPQKTRADHVDPTNRGVTQPGGRSVIVGEVIDPDSFKRPSTAGSGRGFAGSRKKLWEPS